MAQYFLLHWLCDHIGYFQDLLQKMQKREESDRILREKEMDMCKIKLYAHYPTKRQMVEAKLYCASDVTLQEATGMAHRVQLSYLFIFSHEY